MSRKTNAFPVEVSLALSAVIFCAFVPCFSEIIPPDRRIDWTTAGIPGGVPSRSVIFATIDSTVYGKGTKDATAAIQKAIDSCPDNDVVYLPSGTYVVSQTVHLSANTTLRGAGPGKTVISYSDTGGRSVLDMRGLANWDIEGLKRSAAITGGMTKGSTQITLGSASGIGAGDVLCIDQLNDNVLVDPSGSEGFCNYCGRAGGIRARGQFATVTAVSGNTVTLNLPLFWTLSASLSPQATLVDSTAMVRRAGIEDLTVTQTYPAVDFMIEMDAAQFCWLKNIEITRVKRRAVWLIESLQNEIRESYFHGGIAGFGRDHGYAVLVDAYSTHNLIEDNIFSTLDGGFMMTAGGAAGNVFGYNYMVNSKFDDIWWLTQSPSMNHAPHPCMNLWEGNIGIQAGADFIHGSSSHNTLFRCRSFGWERDSTTANNNAIEIQYKNTCYNVLGCVLGTAGKSAVYENAYPATSNTDLKTIWRLGYGGPNGVGDTVARATLIRHGNFDYVNNSTLWDPANSDHALPPSLYKTSKPAFFGALAWPPIGPDLTPMTGMIPAQQRYQQLMPVFEPRPASGRSRTTSFTIANFRSARSVTISFSISGASPVSVKVFSPDGELVEDLFNRAATGMQVIRWNGTDKRGRAVPSGIYFVAFKNGSSLETRMIVLPR
jgi:hypothetical protein